MKPQPEVAGMWIKENRGLQSTAGRSRTSAPHIAWQNSRSGKAGGRANNSYGRHDKPKIRHHGHAFSNELHRNKEAKGQRRNKTASLPLKMFTLMRLTSIQREIEAIGRRHADHELITGAAFPDDA